MATVHKFLPAESSVLAEKRQVRTRCSAGGVDRVGDIVVQSGIDTTNFKKTGGTVLWQHNPDIPIARALTIGLENGQLCSLVQFPPAAISAKADEVFGLIGAGTINCTSIGFRPLESEPVDSRDPYGGTRYTRVELCEFSFVSVPAMPDATVIERSHRRDAGGSSAEPPDVDHVAAILHHLQQATKRIRRAKASHAETEDQLYRMCGYIVNGQRHARALMTATVFRPKPEGGTDDDYVDPDADDDDDVELALEAERRKRLIAITEVRASGPVFSEAVVNMSPEQRRAALAELDGVAPASSSDFLSVRQQIEAEAVQRLRALWKQ